MTTLTLDPKAMARLARIHLDAPTLAALEKELPRVLEWVSQLSEVDVGAPPALATESTPLREDVLEEVPAPEALLCNAPSQNHGFFLVPKILE